jgi:hypothetical protein
MLSWEELIHWEKIICKYYQMELHNIATINTIIEGPLLHIIVEKVMSIKINETFST